MKGTTAALVMAVIIAWGLFWGNVEISHAATQDNISWSVENGVLTISGTGAIANYSKTERPAWEGQAPEITSVVIKEGITSIGETAFYKYPKLEKVSLPATVSSIEKYAFIECKSLKAVTLPKGIKFVHSIAFSDWTVLNCQNPDLQPYGRHGYRRIQQISITGERDYEKAFALLSLVNAERAKRGLSTLTMNTSLMESAMVRSAETAVCFAHTRPDGSSCFELNSTTYSVMYSENITTGASTAKEAIALWVNADGQNDNLVFPGAGSIGIGCFIHNGMTYWVECFSKEKDSANCAKPANRKVTHKIALATDTFKEADINISETTSAETQTSYTYKFKVQFGKNSIKAGETTTAKLCLVNPGLSGATADFDNTGVNWKTSKKSRAKLKQAGKIIGMKKGTATITGSLKYFSASNKIVTKKLPKGKITKITIVNHKYIQVACKKRKNITGYQMRIDDNKNMKTAVIRKTRKVVNRKILLKRCKKIKLEQGEEYYIQTRVFKVVEGKRIYGAWSKMKKVKL